MNTKSFQILALLTIIIVIGAMIANRVRSSAGVAEQPELLFASLKAAINDVAAITVEERGATAQLARIEETWTVKNKDGYAADFEKIKEIVLNLAEMRPLERKTSNPELFKRLGVQDPGPDSSSKRIALFGLDGQELASLIIGDATTQGSASGTYVRLAGEQQSWLVDGRIDVSSDVMNWINKNILKIGRERIASVLVTHPDGTAITIARQDDSTSEFVIQNLPEELELTTPGALGTITNALGFLRLDDVRSAADDGLADDQAVTTRYTLNNDLVITARTWEQDGTFWASFAVTGPQEGEAADEATELNTTMSGWRYALSSYTAGNLRKRLEDITKETAPPTEPQELGPVPELPSQQPPSPLLPPPGDGE